MSDNLITLGPDDQLSSVDDIFMKNKIHHIPVVEGDELRGVVSKSDYLFFRRGNSRNRTLSPVDTLRLSNHKVKEIMTTGIATLGQNDRISVAIEIFSENYFHCIPIVEDNKLQGIVTPYDMMNLLKSTETSESA